MISNKISACLLFLEGLLLHVSRPVRWDSDHGINRIEAWVIGTRNTQKALLFALLENGKELVKAEQTFNYTDRLVLMEELKTMPFGAVWDYYCLSHGVPVGRTWFETVREYETRTLSVRK